MKTMWQWQSVQLTFIDVEPTVAHLFPKTFEEQECKSEHQ